MMLFFIIFLVGIAIYFADDILRRHAKAIYLFSILCSFCAFLVLEDKIPAFRTIQYLVQELFGKGILASVLFLYVMIAPVLSKQWTLRKKIYGLRANLAIIASFLIFSHNLFQSRRVDLVAFSFGTIDSFVYLSSLWMVILLIPLTVTSFASIRKKIAVKQWKKIQKLSYLFYTLFYIHIVLVSWGPLQMGNTGAIQNLIVYTFIFGTYALFRIGIVIQNKYKEISLKPYLARSFSGFICLLFLVYLALCHQTEASYASIESPSKNSTLTIQETLEAIPSSLQESVQLETQGSQESKQDTKKSSAFSKETKAEEGGIYKDGTYQGSAKGYRGNIEIEVEIQGGKISDLKVLSSREDQKYFQRAWNYLSQKILEGKETAELDTVSGATYSSKGIRNAIQNALEQAQ
ncbi:hypothetical protein FACS189418_1870 [Clostridia bacterium]|nr:hypothetical protein FACS189418_1870 [Clostridia bacterium]